MKLTQRQKSLLKKLYYYEKRKKERYLPKTEQELEDEQQAIGDPDQDQSECL